MRVLVGLLAGALALGICLAAGPVAKETGWFGATVKTITRSSKIPPGLSFGSGLLVITVAPDGPAAKAGLRPGDVILSVDGKPATTAEAFINYTEGQGAGTSLTLKRARAGEGEATVTVVLASKLAATAPPSHEKKRLKKASKPDKAREVDEKAAAQEAPKAKREEDREGAEKETQRSRSFSFPEETVDGKAVVGEPRGLDDSSGPTPSAGGATGPDLPYATVRVFYATDRKEGDGKTPGSSYGGDRGPMTYGTCDVTVPKDHRIGELESPSLVRLEFSQDPAKHVVLAKVTRQSAADFYSDVGARLAASKGKSAFIFVHGYNVTFEDAARRTAQMSYDLKFDGAPVFFSWPSQGTYLGYTVDEANIEYARSDLTKFIIAFGRASTAEQIYLVAHSMGNRALASAVADVYRDAPEIKSRIKEVILAAPDIDADVFKRDIAPALIGDGQTVTLYASSKDWALRASKKFHGYVRAGDTGPSLTVVPGVTTIDSSEVETDFFGHSYFAESTSIIADIYDIIAGLLKPEQRTRLVAVTGAQGSYWKMTRGAP